MSVSLTKKKEQESLSYQIKNGAADLSSIVLP